MARLPYLSADEAPPAIAERLERAPDLKVFGLLAHAETAFIPWLRFGASLLRDLALDPELRELAILRVAYLTPGAEYEWIQHEGIAREMGIALPRIASARGAVAASRDDELVLTFTEQVVTAGSPDADVFSAIAERFTPREIIELLLVIGQYMMLGRVMATAQIDVEAATQLESLISIRGRHA